MGTAGKTSMAVIEGSHRGLEKVAVRRTLDVQPDGV